VTLFASLVFAAVDREDSSEPWIAAARILKNGEPSGSGVYLKSGLIVTAAHLTDANAKMGVRMAGAVLPAQMLKQGSFEDVDLSLLLVDQEKVPAGLPRMELCTAPPWPGDPVIVVDAERATRSHIVSPMILPYISWRTKFSTLIGDVATTGNSGSGVFDPNRKCLLGIMSRKFTTHTTEGDKDIAKYFISAMVIRDFMPVEFRPPK